MKTELGKELTKLRVDNDERLIDMAARLGKSASYISAVEIGKRSPTNDIINTIIATYHLAGEAAERLVKAANRATESFRLQADTPIGRDTAALLARRFNTLSPEELEQIQRLLKRSNV